MKILRGDLPAYLFLFNEETKEFKVGLEGQLRRISNIEDEPINRSICFWNEESNRIETANDIKYINNKIMADVDSIDGLHANKTVIDTSDSLATKKNIKTYVDNFETLLRNDLEAHTTDKTNPHEVTQSQVGLSSVPNWNGSTNINLGNSNSTISSQKAVKTYVDTNIKHHTDKIDNPHEVTQSQVGLSNVPNWNAGTSNRYFTETEINNKFSNYAKFGTGTFNSSNGRIIAHGLGSKPVNVQITSNEDPNGYLGEVWVVADRTNIKVYCSGSTTTTDFYWAAFK